MNDFVRFGRVYKVFLQAEPQFTDKPDDIGKFYVRNNGGQMVPLDTLVKSANVRPERRHPLQPLPRRGDHGRARARLQLRAGDEGHRRGHEDHAQRNRLRMVRPDAPGEEIRRPGADHLRHGDPLRLPAAGGAVRELGPALRGAARHADGHPGHAGRHVARHFDNNVYAQIGLVMLIGLAAKNAILIVEFAKMQARGGQVEILDAAVEGSKLRLRPILMTSFAFILGCVPLMLATGSGAASRSTMGTGVVYGMTISTAVGLFLIPVCYVFVQRIVERGGKKPAIRRAAAVAEKGGAH